MDLINQVNDKRKEIRTDGYSISIGEWVSMYENNELDIHPEFQRFYRWTHVQKTSLIESILLGIPLPPIFVSQRKDGVWDVIDGLQRLSTILQLFGILKDEQDKLVDPLTLGKTDYLPALEGKMWSAEEPNSLLPAELKLIIKRSKLSVSIVLKESDETAKYDLFQRLNTGGSQLSQQEVRNCLLIMTNKEFYGWLKELSLDANFVTTLLLSDRPIEEAYDMELALRFFVLATIDESELKSIGDVGDFLTKKMLTYAQDKAFDYTSYAKLFTSTFEVLARTLNESSFRRFNKKKNKHEGGFLVSLFEVVALGVAYNIKNNTLCNDEEMNELARSIADSEIFAQWSSSGRTANRRLPRLIPYGRGLFNKNK